jgi:hypothetical protein
MKRREAQHQKKSGRSRCFLGGRPELESAERNLFTARHA